jgi:hypothetical protein
MKVGYTKDGKRIIGTYDLIAATAFIIGRCDDGELIYDGESKICWDASETKTENGQIIFITENQEYVLEGDVVWRSE